jgi:uncharacterized protein YpuA (DUF1002 family)
MQKNTKLLFVITVFLIMSILSAPVIAAYSRVISFGADLSREQRTMLATEFGVNLADKDVPAVDVTNTEERKYLSGLVPEDVIGNRAISSAMVEMLPAGNGIKVETRNITWVTKDMYANALATARVKDARVMVTAPFEVSGTAALTGIFKGVETATGTSLGDQSKKVANEELVRTGELGEQIGKDKAAHLILLVKEQVVAQKVREPTEIRNIIINVANDLKITLTENQIDSILVLMEKINGLKLDVRDITGQLFNLKAEAEKTIAQKPELKSWFQRLLDIINRLVQQVRTLITGEA